MPPRGLIANDAADVVIVDVSGRPDIRNAADALVAANLPVFMMWESPGNWRWHRIYDVFPEYQIAVVDTHERVIAAAHSVPIAWDGQASTLPAGYDGVLVTATTAGPLASPSALCLLSISVRDDRRGCGLAHALLDEMKARAGRAGHHAVIAPLRPTRKAAHPLMPMETYAAWKTTSDEAFDPWLQLHVGMGADVLGIAEQSLVIAQPRSRWEEVTGRDMSIPGVYLVDGALVPIEIDSRGIGTYREPNIWVCHWIDGMSGVHRYRA